MKVFQYVNCRYIAIAGSQEERLKLLNICQNGRTFLRRIFVYFCIYIDFIWNNINYYFLLLFEFVINFFLLNSF